MTNLPSPLSSPRETGNRLPTLRGTVAIALLACTLCSLAVPTGLAQNLPPRQEFRGAWIATVINLDWPSSRFLSTEAQQDELRTMIEALHQTGINAVFFQIRSEADAMYASQLEPWSIYLTSRQGEAPDPFWDPLAFAIEEAHARGMELHAWMNPYRSSRNLSGDYEKDPLHVSVKNPEWMLDVGNFRLIDPGIPDAREYIVDVIEDVVKRYDIDGIHFDDYFYPYTQIGTQDQATYQTYGSGFSNEADWRRANVNDLVRGVYEMIQANKPDVVFGISPFGIWKSGVPSGINGLSAYDVLYADAVEWLANKWIDYINPQLYWPFGGGQDYAKLAPWWASQVHGRHMYVGHGLYRADAATVSGSLFSPGEVPRQIRFNRNDPQIQGSVFFRAENLTLYSSGGIADSLKNDLYRTGALTPAMTWKNLFAPPAPINFVYEWTATDEIRLTWETPFPGFGEPDARSFVVYRVQAETAPLFSEVAPDPANILAITGNTFLEDSPPQSSIPYHYFLTAASMNSIESVETLVSVLAQPVAVETEPDPVFRLAQNFPNPFTTQTTFTYSLTSVVPVSLEVYNVLGQRVAVLADSVWMNPGEQQLVWNGTDQNGVLLRNGIYWYSFTAGNQRATRALTIVR